MHSEPEEPQRAASATAHAEAKAGDEDPGQQAETARTGRGASTGARSGAMVLRAETLKEAEVATTAEAEEANGTAGEQRTVDEDSSASGSAQAAASDAGQAGEAEAAAEEVGAPDEPPTATAAVAAPGRPHKSLLAGAAIAGVLLVSIPFLLIGGDDGKDHKTSKGLTPGTELAGGTEWGAPGAFGSEPPSPRNVPGASSAVSDPSKRHARGPGNVNGVKPSPASSGHNNSSSGSKKPSKTRTSSGKPSSGGSSVDSGAVASVRVWSHASNRCIDALDGQTANGTPLQIWDCGGVNWQKWQFRSDGTVRTLGKCMTLAGSSTAKGTAIVLSTCNGSSAQQFRLNEAHDLVNPRADMCVDVKNNGTANGSRLQLWSCNGQDNQKWTSG
ncbi:ricin-type beta-trefoil lectin domain protein [Streptomyces sp. NPDC057717]|uniref:ricin-type beta-trefoil lectin domain protein n=1 Tax=Streptomyces sp. NPDC057717 TaxID=3346224 RepID=UPI00367E6795